MDKAGLFLGLRVTKSRFLVECESQSEHGGASEGALGTVSHFDSSDACTCSVLWDNGDVCQYSVGRDDNYDLEIAPQMTTISSDTQDAFWNCAITLRVRNPTEAVLEITIWDREYYLGETLLRVEGLLGYQGAQPPMHDD